MKSVGIATLKTLGTQYSSFSGVVQQVSQLHAEFESELTQVLNLLHKKQTNATNDVQRVDENSSESSVVSPEPCKDNNVDENSDDQELNDIKDDKSSWQKKLFKRIAIHCHPDKVLPANFSSTEKHKRLSSYEQARSALDDNDSAMMISIGLLYGEIAEVGIVESKKILTSGVTALQGELDVKQKSLIWAWGVSEEDFERKTKILIHAAAKLYNMKITSEQAVSVINEYFEIAGTPNRRKVGTHPGRRLRDRRDKC